MHAIWLAGLAVPAAFGLHALKTDFFPSKAMVTLSCIVICLLSTATGNAGSFAGLPFLLAALLLSIAGDAFLSFKSRNPNFYLYGILTFFGAHACYLACALSQRTVAVVAPALMVLLGAALLVYYVRRIAPHVDGMPMKIAVFAYTMISCVTFSCAAAAAQPWNVHLPFAAAIGLILYSDLCIGETDFAGNARMKGHILPTYYLAHMLLATAVVLATG